MPPPASAREFRLGLGCRWAGHFGVTHRPLEIQVDPRGADHLLGNGGEHRPPGGDRQRIIRRHVLSQAGTPRLGGSLSSLLLVPTSELEREPPCAPPGGLSVSVREQGRGLPLILGERAIDLNSVPRPHG
jgi:hypothetical protein